MKATLEFNLPDEDIEFGLAVDGIHWHAVVSDIDQFLRDKVKHGEEPQAELEIYGRLRDLLYEFIADRNLTLNA